MRGCRWLRAGGRRPCGGRWNSTGWLAGGGLVSFRVRQWAGLLAGAVGVRCYRLLAPDQNCTADGGEGAAGVESCCGLPAHSRDGRRAQAPPAGLVSLLLGRATPNLDNRAVGRGPIEAGGDDWTATTNRFRFVHLAGRRVTIAIGKKNSGSSFLQAASARHSIRI